MRSIAEFTKTTLIGGVIIIMPVYLSVLLLLKGFAGVLALVAPIHRGTAGDTPVPRDGREKW